MNHRIFLSRHADGRAGRTARSLRIAAVLIAWAAAAGAHAGIAAADTGTTDDLIQQDGSGQFLVGASTGSLFVAPVAFADWAGSDVKFADVDGDGHADLVERNPNTFAIRVGLSNGSSFSAPVSFGSWANGSEPWYLADVNGDGRADIVGRVPSTKQIIVGLSNGTAFRAAQSFTGWNGIDFKFADVDGDGRADIVNRDAGTGDIQVGLSSGTGYRASVSWGTWGNGNEPWYLADVSGDGRADIIGRDPSTLQVNVSLSTGSSFAAPVSFTGWRGTDFKFADVSGDGKADIVNRDQSTGEVQVGFSTGTAFLPSVHFGTASASSAPWFLANVADAPTSKPAPGPAPTPTLLPAWAPPPTTGTANGTGGSRSTAKVTITGKTKVFTARFGGTVAIKGAVLDGAGVPLTGATIDVMRSIRGQAGPPAFVTSVTTNAAGVFSYAAPGTTSGTLEFAYGPVVGTRTYTSTAAANVHVSISPTLALSRNTIEHGQSVTFTGKVDFAPLPKSGVRVVIEGYRKGQKTFQTSAVVRSRAGGEFRWSHRFAAVASWTIRARVLGTDDLQGTPGHSASQQLTVR